MPASCDASTRTDTSTHRRLRYHCWESRQKTKKFLAMILLIPRSILHGCINTRREYGIHTFEDRTRGLRSRINVVDVVIRRRRPRGRVVEQLDGVDANVQAVSPNSHDDECRTRSTSRIPRASGEEDLPSGLQISRAAEACEVDPKFLQHRGVLEVDRSPNHGPLHGAAEVRRSETILLERESQHRISVRLKANSTPSVPQPGASQAEERGRRERQPRARCVFSPP